MADMHDSQQEGGFPSLSGKGVGNRIRTDPSDSVFALCVSTECSDHSGIPNSSLKKITYVVA